MVEVHHQIVHSGTKQGLLMLPSCVAWDTDTYNSTNKSKVNFECHGPMRSAHYLILSNCLWALQ